MGMEGLKLSMGIRFWCLHSTKTRPARLRYTRRAKIVMKYRLFEDAFPITMLLYLFVACTVFVARIRLGVDR